MKKFRTTYIFYMLILASAMLTAQNAPSKKSSEKEIRLTQTTRMVMETDGNNVSSVAKPRQKSSSGTYDAGSVTGLVDVSPTGGLTYNVPISLPPGIKEFVPSIALNYNGQGGNSTAGYGWNISGLSSISRISASSFHDGETDPVDFDQKDRFMLDGQRLVLKSGSYGADGSEYQTERFSNLRIRAYGTSPYGSQYGPSYFIIFYPNGNIAWYGNSPGTKDRLKWCLYTLKDPQNNVMRYYYEETGGLLQISEIRYGGRTNTAPKNSIRFLYKNRTREEHQYVGGQGFSVEKVLDRIEVKTGSQLYRRYTLEHYDTFLGYPVLNSITETNKNGKSLAPVIFEYEGSTEEVFRKRTQGDRTTIFPGVDSKKHIMVSGDYNGDGGLDMVLYEKEDTKEFNLFTDIAAYNKTAIAQKKTFSQPIQQLLTTRILSASNTVMNRDAITVVQEIGTKVEFKSYIKSSLGIQFQYTKSWNGPTYSAQTSCGSSPRKAIPGKYISADFTGDGLSDVVVVHLPVQQKICYTDAFFNCKCDTSTNTSKKISLIELDRRKTSNFSSSAGTLALNIKEEDQVFAADIDGDGVAELVHVSEGKMYSYRLNQNKTFSLYSVINDEKIKLNRPILFGDYNGDGKPDFCVPSGNKSTSWKFFMGTGSNFTSFTKDIKVWYGDNEISNVGYVFNGERLQAGNPTIIKLFEYHYTAQDVNADGKTDIISHNVITPRDNSNYSGERFSLFVNTGIDGNARPNFQSKAYRQIDNEGITKFGFPIFMNLNQRTDNLEYAYVDGNYIYGYEFGQDHRKDVQMKTIYNNGVTTAVKYNTDEREDEPAYSSTYILPYPYTVAPHLKGMQLVSRLIQSGSINQYRDFQYNSAVSHINGLGFLGFKINRRTNWYGDGVGTLWEMNLYDHTKRGALAKTWISQSPGNSVYNPISLTTNTYTPYTAQNKRYTLSLNKSVSTDYLTGVTNTTTYILDAYQNPTQIKTTHRDGYETADFTYYNDPAPLSDKYHVGRVKSKTETQSIKGQTFRNSESYTYSNNLLTKLIKKGNGSATLTYQYKYDNFGNVIRKESPGTGYTFVEQYSYDTSGRYIITSTDHLGLKSLYTYDVSTGMVSSATDEHGLKTTFIYDGWNREKESKDYLGKITTTSYTRSSNGGMSSITYYPDGGKTYTVLNSYGWKILDQAKSIKNKHYNISYRYDAAGRIIEESEPYLSSSSATQWNKTDYDVYGRVINHRKYTGKVITTSYNELTVTVNDGTKTMSTISDTFGNIAQVTDPGGTITYSYYGNGALKTADYDSYKVQVSIDQWGRKTRLQDPSAGVYTYTYNKIGQITEETTPKGRTSYTYSNKGLLTSKILNGDQTNMQLQYGYDSKYRNYYIFGFGNDNQNYTYNYTFDNYNRVTKITEKVGGKNPAGDFSKSISYDDLGRPLTNIYSSKNQLDGSSSVVKVNNYYDAGQLSEIREQGTNKVLWKLEDETVRNQNTKITLGNGIIKTRSFNTLGRLTQILDKKQGQDVKDAAMYMRYSFHNTRKILNSRRRRTGATETFGHDNLDRLTNENGITHGYDQKGRIQRNGNYRDYSYDQTKQYQVKEIKLPYDFGPDFRNKKIQQVTYNSYKKPVEIYLENKGRVSFDYGPMMNRVQAFYGSLNTDKNKRPFRKVYSSIMPVEMVYHQSSKKTKIITYIGGDAYSAPIAHIKGANGDNKAEFHYLHRDYLGSIMGITNSSGDLVEENEFGAWGDSRFHTSKVTGVFAAEKFMLGRGFTGHEHFNSVELIHMNGRLYDSLLHRFLSPDNYVQDPFNTQSFNRYGYVWNNPLIFNDKTGEYLGIDDLIAAIIGGAVNLTVNIVNGNLSGMGFWETLGKGSAAFLSGAAAGTLALYGPAGWAAGGALVSGTNSWLSGNKGWDIVKDTGIGAFTGLAGGAIGKWAGQLGGVLINNMKVASPLLQGVIGGAFGGGITNSTLTFGMALASGASFNQALEAGGNAFVSGVVTGAVVGGASASANSLANGINPINNKPLIPDTQKPNSNNLGKFPEGHIQTNKPGSTGTPNSSSIYTAPNGKPISKHFFNSEGKLNFEINYKIHNMGFPHGHNFTVPGIFQSGHLPENHIPFMLIPRKYF